MDGQGSHRLVALLQTAVALTAARARATLHHAAALALLRLGHARRTALRGDAGADRCDAKNGQDGSPSPFTSHVSTPLETQNWKLRSLDLPRFPWLRRGFLGRFR